MTSPSKLPLAQTTELYTGDHVHFDKYDRKTDNQVFTVLATNSPCSCESGTLVCVRANTGKGKKYTVDRHWLVLDVKASDIDFDDDIPF